MNFYDVLGVDADATRGDIRDAYRDLARDYHPDVNEHPEASDQFKVLNKAREVLADPDERNAYDRLGHADYVSTRLPGDLPEPEMMPQTEGAGGSAAGSSAAGTTADSTTTASTGTGSPTAGTSASDSASGSGPTPSGSDSGAASGSTTRGGGRRSGGTSSGGASSASGSPGGPSSTGGGTTTDTGGSSQSTGGASTSSTASGTSTSRGRGGSGRAHSTPPTPGSAESPSSRGARGPQRVSDAVASQAARWEDTYVETLRSHLAASNRWLAVVAAAALYFGGVGGYLATHADGVDQLSAALTAADPTAVARALAEARYDVPDVLGYAGETGLVAGYVPTDAAMLVAGALLLPPALAGAVAGLRRETTWRPSWMHVVGALGPATSIGIAYAIGAHPDTVPLSSVPLLVDLLLLVGFPAVVLLSFLLTRLVLVFPLRRREDLGLP